MPSVRATAARRALKAEWTKLRTLPSTWRTVAMTVVAAIGFSAIATAVQASSWATMSAQQRQAFDPTSTSLTGLWVAVVILGALGVRSVAAEYTTGMIRATFTAMPARRASAGGQGRHCGRLCLPAGPGLRCRQLRARPAHPRRQARRGRRSAIPVPSRPSSSVRVAASLVTIVGVGLAGVIRHTAGAVTALAMLILGGAILGQMVPAGLRQYIPGIAVQAAVTVHRSAGLLRPGAAVLVLCAYAAVALGAAAVRMAHRDA